MNILYVVVRVQPVAQSHFSRHSGKLSGITSGGPADVTCKTSYSMYPGVGTTCCCVYGRAYAGAVDWRLTLRKLSPVSYMTKPAPLAWDPVRDLARTAGVYELLWRPRPHARSGGSRREDSILTALAIPHPLQRWRGARERGHVSGLLAARLRSERTGTLAAGG